MPKLWTETIESHRRAVGEAVLDATAAVVAEHGLGAVTMSAIAQRAGVGRATLYKYFPDVEAVLAAWHERQVGQHLQHLAAAVDHADREHRLQAALTAYAGGLRGHSGSELAALLHRGEHVTAAHRQLTDLLTGLLAEGAASGQLRDDVPAGELAGYVLGALSAAAGLPSEAAVARLVTVTLAGLRPD